MLNTIYADTKLLLEDCYTIFALSFVYKL